LLHFLPTECPQELCPIFDRTTNALAALIQRFYAGRLFDPEKRLGRRRPV
jgi:hypothetical protein